jgi:hypothetical protein
MKLTRIIFDKWKIWMTLPDRTLMWALKSKENLGFYDWYIMDGETRRLLEGVWFNDVKKGKYD